MLNQWKTLPPLALCCGSAALHQGAQILPALLVGLLELLLGMAL